MKRPPVDIPADVNAAAERVLARSFGGIHHVEGWGRREYHGPNTILVRIHTPPGGLSTYDFDQLTRLVVAAHDEHVRLALHPGGPYGFKLVMTLRREWQTPTITDGHPTMEQALERCRR